MTKIKYIGPHDAVDVPLPDGSAVLTVQHGATVEVDTDHGLGLLEQPTNWERVVTHRTTTTITTKAPKADTKPAPDAPAEKEA